MPVLLLERPDVILVICYSGGEAFGSFLQLAPSLSGAHQGLPALRMRGLLRLQRQLGALTSALIA